MGRIGSKQCVPLITALFAAVFFVIGVTQLGFWDGNEGPQSGFFPVIISIVMFASSIAAFFQTLKDEEKANYNKLEFLVIAAAAGILVGTQIIGLVASCFIFVFVWLRFYEKTRWRDIIIILAVIAFIVLGVFGAWLGVQFPLGLFEMIR